MESVLGGFQMPLQRRLTKMYTDTKSSYEFVKEPTQVAEIPELSTLHRKLRIQKDRLITWGLAWSDTTESPDIDESLSKAGLSDVVGSVMSTIKDILAEAEPLWQASRRPSEDKGKRIGDHKTPVVLWDRGRFEDLVQDLTSSIDTLYDLSRTRRSARQTPTMRHMSSTSSFQAKIAAEALRQFDSTRMQTPQQIDPSSLITDPRDPHSTILYSSLAGTFPVGLAGSRQIVYLRRPTPSASPRKPGGAWSAVPVLLEYAAYDPVYANTGIHPSMSRFEKLFAGLQMGMDSFGRPDFGALNLIGYFEEPTQAHFGLLYELPTRFAPLDGEKLSNFAMPYAATLSDLLCNPALEPSLEFKYRLAYNLSKTVFDLHSKGIMHGNLATTNVIFLEQQSPGSKDIDALSEVNVRHAYVTSFDLFPDSAIQQANEDVYGSNTVLYKHPLDPRVTPHTILTHESRSLDVYSLAMILLEIGLWRPLAEIFPPHLGIPDDLSGVYKQLAARCGSRYLQAAKACWRAINDEMSNCSRPEVQLQKVYGRVMRALEGCCVPDDGVDEDDTEVFSLNVSAKLSKISERERSMEAMSNVTKAREEYYKKKATSSQPSEKQPTKLRQGLDILTPIETSLQTKSKDKWPREKREAATPKVQEIAELPVTTPKPRYRIFLAIKISQEHLDYWHTVLMPRINYALRGFYRKYPESVEISLESIGETAHKTKPTILVVCTSVGKVRSVLKRSFVYDSSTFGLLVCRGKILRSRKDQPKRSAASDTELRPANPDYQERPFSGASIGAYIEGHPLPPVTFGGLIMIDNKPYGLTVHHMLDDPEDPEDDLQATQPPTRSSGHGYHIPTLDNAGSFGHSIDNDEYGYEISEFGSEFGSDAYSEGSQYSDEESVEDDADDRPREPGDIEGIPQDCGRGYVVTQPAMDDVTPEMYFPEEEDRLDTYGLGEIYASSGIRRRHEGGSVHEVDWALFKFIPERLPLGNYTREGGKHCRSGSPYPVDVAPWSKLHDLEVHCMARTTGLQTGRILPGMSIVKIFGRQTPSQSYQVSGGLGVPGDSGAWLIDKKQGLACGHVLAWSSRKKVAYICPMQILLKDIAETLDAQSVCFPHAAVIRMDETEYGDDASMGQESLLGDNPPTPQQGEPLHTENMKPPMAVRYAIAADDDIVSALDAMQVSPSVISHG